jgi:hypothetical protein
MQPDKVWIQERIKSSPFGSIRKLAPKLSMDASALSRAINGERKLSVQEATALADILGVSLHDLLTKLCVVKEAQGQLLGIVVGSSVQMFKKPEPFAGSGEALQVRDPSSLYDGAYVMLRNTTPPELDRLALINNSAIGKLLRGYSPSKYNIQTEGEVLFDKTIKTFCLIESIRF